MGAGNRIGIPNFKITDISKTYNDGLAKVVRKKLKNENISKLDVAFCEDLPVVKGEITGSISYFPSMCGCVISSYVIEKLINK
jgi:tRNA A37 threonylcarbamoyladenosine dehydratase